MCGWLTQRKWNSRSTEGMRPKDSRQRPILSKKLRFIMSVDGKMGWCCRMPSHIGFSTTKVPSAISRRGRFQYPAGDESNFVVPDHTPLTTVLKSVKEYS